MKNVKLAVAVINHILDHPETWSQQVWHCRTTHSFAGHVQIMGSCAENVEKCYDAFIKLLECSREDAAWLAYTGRTLSELHTYVKSYVEGTPYFDADGYDPIGYDRHGHCRHGFDQYGYDRYGYDRYGFDRYGYDRRGNRLTRLTAE